METVIRGIEEAEIPKMAKFLVEGEGESEIGEEGLKKNLQAQFHQQRDLLIAIFEKKNGTIVGMITAKGQGDTVSVIYLRARREGFNKLTRELITAEEKAARRYGYSRIYLSGTMSQKNFLLNLGYKPRLLFTFSNHRRETFELLCELYPLWIEAGGQEVKALLGGDHLDIGTEKAMKNLPVRTDYLFLKTL